MTSINAHATAWRGPERVRAIGWRHGVSLPLAGSLLREHGAAQKHWPTPRSHWLPAIHLPVIRGATPLEHLLGMSMRTGFRKHATNISREDRLLRVILALLMLALAAFGVLGGNRLTLASLSFALLGIYCTVTAWAGRCWLYEVAEVDTRSESERDAAQLRAYEAALRSSQAADRWATESAVLAGDDSAEQTVEATEDGGSAAPGHVDHSLLGS